MVTVFSKGQKESLKKVIYRNAPACAEAFL